MPVYLEQTGRARDEGFESPVADSLKRSVEPRYWHGGGGLVSDEGFESSALPKHQRGGVLEKNSPYRDDSLAAKPEGIRVDPRCIEPSVLKWSAAVQIGHPDSRFVLPETGSDRSSPRFRPGCCIFLQNPSPCPTFWCNLTRPLHQKQLSQP
jgi:hypothetical protein